MQPSDVRRDSDGDLDVRGDFDRHSDIGGSDVDSDGLEFISKVPTGKTKSLPVGQTLKRTSSQPPYFVYGSAYLKVVSAHFIYSPIQWIHCGPVEILLATAPSHAAMFSLMSLRGPPALPVSAGGPLDDAPISTSPPPFFE